MCTLPMYATAVTHQRWLWSVKFALEALEGSLVSEVCIPGLSHNPIGRSHME